MPTNSFINRREDYVLVNEFNSTYWSGLDMTVFANSVLVDECIQFSYQIVEQVKPHFGYNSYVADKIWHGNRIITGEMTLNFTRDSYLYSLINTLKTSDDAITKAPVRTSVGSTGIGEPLQVTAVEWTKLSTRNFLDSDISADALVNYAKARKKQASTIKTSEVLAAVPSVQTDAGLFYTIPSGFDLNILYGTTMVNPVVLRQISDEDQYIADGTILPPEKSQPIAFGTGIKLKNVSLMGRSFVSDDSGRPIMETWSFMAADLRVLTVEEVKNQRQQNSIFEKVLNDRPGDIFEVPDFGGTTLDT